MRPVILLLQLTCMVPLDRVDLDAGRRSIAENAGISRLHRDVEELDGVAAARGQKGLY